ncbi:NAD(P)H-dependent oxidoreductase [Microbacterium chocolatum]|uniref:FMN-dependent NADH-azoreductase n=1 Tax=Microbacterium aurantiacum TaxID=162393 RepID=UPI00338DC2E8
MTLFRLDASILPATSASRELADMVEAEWTAAHPASDVRRRDLSLEPVPATTWRDAVQGGFTPEDGRTPDQREAIALAQELAAEVLDAEGFLFAVPLYNYGVSQHFKTWFDVVSTVPGLDPQGTALRGKPATLVTVLGGNYAPGTPKEGWDHSTAWLRRVLTDVWGLDLRIVHRPFTLVGVNPALDAFREPAAELKREAESAAVRAGRELAELRGAS